MTTTLIELKAVTKSFGEIEVLHGIGLSANPGEVLALIGENGAGKSTLMKIIAGYQVQTAGHVYVNGTEQSFTSMREAEDLGIVMIHQEFNLAEQLTVEQNFFLGREVCKGLLLDKAYMREQTRYYLDQVNCAADVDAPVSNLSNSDKQMVEIAKALSRDAKLLIMDEPTAVLTNKEASTLFEQVEKLRQAGTAVIFTSHKLDEVKQISDKVAVMRDGAIVHFGTTSQLSEDQMATLMVGREITALYPIKPAAIEDTEIVLRVNNLSVDGYAEGLSFELKKGEVLGIAGLVGSGRTEAMEGLCGLRKAETDIELFGERLSIHKPNDALSRGLCYMTEDRKIRGLLLERGMRENLTLQTLSKFGRFFIDRNLEEVALDEAITEFDIRGNRDVNVGNLSGGNQQKVLLAKTMLSVPKILVIDEPTRGIDIGTKEQIYHYLRGLADKGMAIIVISSEMQEIIGLADHVLVMRLGRLQGELEGDDITENQIVRLAMGVEGVTTTNSKQESLVS